MPSRSADTYLFIDGQYLRRRYTDAMQGAFRSDGKIDIGLMTFVGYEEIDEMEKQFKARWQHAEQENLWNLINQSVSET
jgi:hypothetical protein